MGRPMAPRPMKPTRTPVDATSAAPCGGPSVERWRVDELVFVSQVAPYADGPAGVHGVLDQAATAAVQLAGMHGLRPDAEVLLRVPVDQLDLTAPGARAPGFGYPIAWCV